MSDRNSADMDNVIVSLMNARVLLRGATKSMDFLSEEHQDRLRSLATEVRALHREVVMDHPPPELNLSEEQKARRKERLEASWEEENPNG